MELLEFRKHKHKQKAEEDVVALGIRIDDIIDQENKLSTYADKKHKRSKPAGSKSNRKYAK